MNLISRWGLMQVRALIRMVSEDSSSPSLKSAHVSLLVLHCPLPTKRRRHSNSDIFNLLRPMAGFRWAPWGIEWEVNGNVVRTVENTGGVETPVVTADTVQKVMANIWIVSQSIENGFGGPFDFDSFTETNAQYKWIRYEKMDSNGCCSISPAC